MKNGFPTEETIRGYLLGRLDDPDLRDRLSEQMFLNAELSEVVDSIEDEIIEEYLDGRVNAIEKKTIEEYFLRPPERREKLEFARFLRDHFKTTGEVLVKKKLNAGHETTPQLLGGQSATPLILHWQSHYRTYYELAACILLIALNLLYVSRVSHRWQDQFEATLKNNRQLEGELAQEREHSANLTKQLEQLQPPEVTLTFLGPIFRDKADIRVVEIRPWTKQIKVEIGLPGMSSADYDVRLENNAQKVIWSQPHVTASLGGLRFELPVKRVPTGTYCLIVSSRPEPYCFQARVSKTELQ